MIAQNGLALHLSCGIPVVDVSGAWSEAVDRVLQETVAKLVRAGHFEIIINLSSLTDVPLRERGWLEGLERLATSIRTRCGRLDIVGTVDQVRERLRRQAQTCVRWATSEEEAVCRLKGIPRAANGLIVSARLDDK